MGTFDFAVRLRCLRFDIHMPHALVFDMPVKMSLKLMSSVGSDRADPEGKCLAQIVQEPDRARLVMFGKDL